MTCRWRGNKTADVPTEPVELNRAVLRLAVGNALIVRMLTLDLILPYSLVVFDPDQIDEQSEAHTDHNTSEDEGDLAPHLGSP